jgi:small conductance mechanosensitive channel
MNFQKLYDGAVDFIWAVGPNLLLAIVVLLVGLWIIKLLTRGTQKALSKAEIDPSLSRFMLSLINLGLKVLLLISVAGMVGIATTSFVAVLGAIGLAVGFALQGSLANFAGGVLILLFKPFRVDDVIEAQGFLGKVYAIQIFNTVLKTFDNKTIIIPNGALSNGSIMNFSSEKQRRVDMSFGIGYGDDIKKAKEILTDLISNDPRVLKEPAPMIVVSELGESSVNFAVRAWVEAADYWPLYFEMQEKVKMTFDEKGISIPFPQRDVHLYQAK